MEMLQVSALGFNNLLFLECLNSKNICAAMWSDKMQFFILYVIFLAPIKAL